MAGYIISVKYPIYEDTCLRRVGQRRQQVPLKKPAKTKKIDWAGFGQRTIGTVKLVAKVKNTGDQLKDQHLYIFGRLYGVYGWQVLSNLEKSRENALLFV